MVTDTEKITVKFGGYQGPRSIHTLTAKKFGEELQKCVGTHLEFELEESVIKRGLKSGDLPGLVASGKFDLCYISTVRCTKVVPEFALFELPFLIKDRASVFSALDGKLGTYFQNKLEKSSPFKLLGFWDNGFRHISNSVRPIETLRDCQGLTIRTQMSDLHGEVFRSFGFKPMAMDIKDFLNSIDSRKIDAQDNPLTSIYIFDIYKHHRFISLSGHFFGVSLLLCNRQAFEKWPVSVQEQVVRAATEATIIQRKLAAEQDRNIIAILKSEDVELIEIKPEEKAQFSKCTSGIVERYEKKLGRDLFELLQA